MNDTLSVKIQSVDSHILPFECDSVLIPITDDRAGKFSGVYGVKKGHANALFSLKKGDVVVSKDGSIIFTAEISEGFAVIENNILSITVDNFIEKVK